MVVYIIEVVIAGLLDQRIKQDQRMVLQISFCYSVRSTCGHSIKPFRRVLDIPLHTSRCDLVGAKVSVSANEKQTLFFLTNK